MTEEQIEEIIELIKIEREKETEALIYFLRVKLEEVNER